jgi:L-2-aminoadipate reductase
VPALELYVDGTIVGGPGSGDSDVLVLQYSMEDADPDVVLGPDSIATLSFTSGSTGIPKGVRGRHYSLTHFFPWMGQEFSIGQTSKFTMLSGIAHDPIQRDSEIGQLLFTLHILTPSPQCLHLCSSERSFMFRPSTTSIRPGA